MTIQGDFSERFPEFSQNDVDTYLPILADVWPAYFAKPYEGNKEIVLNLIAHLLVTEKQPGTGPIQGVASKSAGSVSASYHARQSGRMEDFFHGTKYGQRYLHLTRFKGGAVWV